MLIKAGEVEISKAQLSAVKRSIPGWSRQYRLSRAVRSIIIALGDVGRWDEVLALSAVSQDIWNDWNWADEQLTEFLNALINAGKMSEARRIAQQAWQSACDIPAYASPPAETAQSMAMNTISRAIAQSDLIVEAKAIFDECSYSVMRQKIAFDLANTLADKGRFPEALLLLDHVELDQYVEAFCKWAPALEKVESGLAFATLREVIRIVGWVREDWHEIYELTMNESGD